MSRWIDRVAIRKQLELTLEIVIPESGERNTIIRSLLEDNIEYLKDKEAIDQFLTQAIQRLNAGEPVQYITGKAHFLGNIFTVTPDVLIPRPETEEMTDLALKFLKTRAQKPTILDLGTGSGCVAISIKKSVPQSKIIAWDISGQALDIAQHNASQHKTDIHFIQIDALSPTSWQTLAVLDLDLIISNPPYIGNNERHAMDAHVILHEPGLALFAPGDDPLIFYRVIASDAGQYLKPDGKILCECSTFTADVVHRLFLDAGWLDVELQNDLSGNPRFIIAGHYAQPPAGLVPE